MCQKHVSPVCIDRWKSDIVAFFKFYPGISMTCKYSANYKIGSSIVLPYETKFHSDPRTSVNDRIIIWVIWRESVSLFSFNILGVMVSHPVFLSFSFAIFGVVSLLSTGSREKDGMFGFCGTTGDHSCSEISLPVLLQSSWNNHSLHLQLPGRIVRSCCMCGEFLFFTLEWRVIDYNYNSLELYNVPDISSYISWDMQQIIGTDRCVP